MAATSQHTPRVSVIIPVYNQGQFLTEAVESVLSQTFQNFEILLVDDGSTDQSPEIIKEYTQKYPQKIKYLEHQNHTHAGVSPSRNLGIQHAAGEYIALIDSDDLWLPEKLEKQIEILDMHQEVGLVYCALEVIDENGKPTQKMYNSSVIGGGIPGKMDDVFEEFFSITMTMWLGSTPLVRKHILFEIGLFDNDLTHGEDAVVSIKIAYLYPLFFLPQPLVKYRVHTGNASWDWVIRNNVHRMRYQVMSRVCQWLKNTTEEYHTDAFRIRLAQLSYETYQKHMVSRWGLLKLLGLLFPYRSPTMKLVKIFVSLFLGYRITGAIQKILNRIRGPIL